MKFVFFIIIFALILLLISFALAKILGFIFSKLCNEKPKKYWEIYREIIVFIHIM